MTNMAVFWSPSMSSSISSYRVSSRSSAISNGANLAPQLIKIDLAVFPAASLYLRYWRTAKCSGFSASSSSNNSSTAFLNSSSSSLVSLALINSSRVEKLLYTFFIPPFLIYPNIVPSIFLRLLRFHASSFPAYSCLENICEAVHL